MKLFHTADWHLGKLVQGVYMTDDQRYVLEQFLQAIDEEQPDAVIIAGDLYDRALPPVEAVDLLDEILAEIVLKRKVPVLSIAGNHDSPTRLQFGSKLMKETGLHIAGEITNLEPIILNDEFGEVHFHLVPFAEPSTVKSIYEDNSINTHDDAMKKVIEKIEEKMDKSKRHVFVGHAFVTPYGEKLDNTSDSERPLAIGGSECVSAEYFNPFHYTALGHLHKAHYVLNETIRYSGSPLKYSSSEANHEKGYLIVDLDKDGQVSIEKRKFNPRRELRIVEGSIQEILRTPVSEDYVFVRLTDLTPVVGAMEQIRTVYPNAMHVERKALPRETFEGETEAVRREQLDDFSLFKAFHKEILGQEPSEIAEQLFEEVLQEMLSEERETTKEVVVK
ncbi:exonuclease SbcCD subunit D [Ureibacillus chungkukjangi]|uniref:Nuclease SbcCD subunit D n=1 Tax=Ureibacillus chungkukjangi TaxID=1202712 RepID=A0A318TLY1_9BACL|nr:exonuclease SbcCD subunit D [Ureibacillus chungkukjangi]MCM3388536.1 exonuclease SbcCD subunit D [Ureibacillus chungkukjangi]PYF05851.1 exodeoxyribonuclease I subunit D [Ureibacillus chungkukjangi]